MAHIVRTPALGAAIANVTVVRWLVGEGAEIAQGETLLEVETDKMNMEIPAERAGRLHRILARAGTTTTEGRPLAILGEDGEDVSAFAAQALAELGSSVEAASDGLLDAVPSGDETGKVRATPVARRVAKELGIDLRAVVAAGAVGILNEDDVRRYHAQRGSTSPQEATGRPGGDVDVIPLIGARKVLAERMVESARTIPHVTMTLEIDCEQLIAARAALAPEFDREAGGKLTFTPFLVKAIARAVQDVPIVNATLVGEEIHVHRTANVGVAVAVEDLIVVPVVRSPIVKSVLEIGHEVIRLTERARRRTLDLEDTRDGTITLSNVGGTAVVGAAPIINPPQSAIVMTTRIVDRVVPHDGAIAVRPQMNAVFAFDHRVVQGVPGARFAERVKAYLEDELVVD
jgi:pyruvate/2-oxoglutarate dehydrogenase complex dihydrolipoamide acyltransferase (E2) component